MKLTFKWANDHKYHEYCLNCHAETVESGVENGQSVRHCRTCGQSHERSIIIDPAITSWVAEDGEYWHESAGIFARNVDRRYLFFERTLFPVGLITVPAGHVDAGEAPAAGAARELTEEAGITASNLVEFAATNIPGDSCRRGSDAHRWHAFLAEVKGRPKVEIDHSEGAKPVWLSLEECKTKPLTFPVKYIIEHYADKLG